MWHVVHVLIENVQRRCMLLVHATDPTVFSVDYVHFIVDQQQLFLPLKKTSLLILKLCT